MIGDLRYFAIISIAFCFGLIWFARRAEQFGLSQKTAMDLTLPGMIVGFFAARFAHVFIEEPKLYFAFPSQIYRVWEGGFVWYGGVIAAFATGIWLAKRKGEPVTLWLDVSAPVLAASYALGRMACWFEGCCFGRHCEIASHQFQIPAQLFAVAWDAGIAFYLLYSERRRATPVPTGYLFAMFMVLHGLGRVLMELMRGDPRGPALGPVTFSFLVSAGLIAFGFAWRKSLISRAKP